MARSSQVVQTLLTTAQVARQLELSRAMVLLAIKQGDLVPEMKLPCSNGTYLISEDAVIAWRTPGERLEGL